MKMNEQKQNENILAAPNINISENGVNNIGLEVETSEIGRNIV